MASRPEHQAPPELFYSESEARKYTQSCETAASATIPPNDALSDREQKRAISACCVEHCHKRPSWLPPPRGLLALLGGFIIHLSLGSLYTLGNLSPYIVSYVHNYSEPADLPSETTGWLFGAAAIGQGVSMSLGGLLELKIGPRYTTLVGGFVMSLGVMLSALAIRVSFWFLLFTHGVLFGLGTGLAYIAPMVCAMRWLPRWKGMANGVVVSGYGLGGLLLDLLQTYYLNPDNLGTVLSEGGDNVFIDQGILSRVPTVFLICGAVYMVVQFIGCILLTNPTHRNRCHSAPLSSMTNHHGSFGSEMSTSTVPPESSLATLEVGMPLIPSPNNTTSPDPQGRELEMMELDPERGKEDEGGAWTTNIISSVTPLRMLKTPNFYHLWVVFVLNSTTLACIFTMYKLFGQTVINNDLFFAATGAVASLFNFTGRIFWGFLADLVTFKLALVSLSAVITALALTFYATTLGTNVVFFVWVCAVFFCVGGTFVLFPTAIARSYGPKYIGVNYGLLFTAHIVVGVVSSLLSTSPTDWSTFFFVASAFSALAFLLMMCFRNKRYILTI